MFSVGKLCDEPCIWCMCDRKRMRVCNLLCDVILSTPSSPAQSVGVGNRVHLQHCVLHTFIVHQRLPIKVDIRGW